MARAIEGAIARIHVHQMKCLAPSSSRTALVALAGPLERQARIVQDGGLIKQRTALLRRIKHPHPDKDADQKCNRYSRRVTDAWGDGDGDD